MWERKFRVKIKGVSGVYKVWCVDWLWQKVLVSRGCGGDEYVKFDRIEALMQYTGLKDMDGKKIFEGDIVVQRDYPWFDNGEPNYIGVVKMVFSAWQVVMFCINPKKRGLSNGISEMLNDDGYDNGDWSDWEIIGNIYEHPERYKINYD